VFYSERDIPADYVAMGALSIVADQLYGQNQVIEEVKSKAMKQGADAVLIGGIGRTSTSAVGVGSGNMVHMSQSLDHTVTATLYKKKGSEPLPPKKPVVNPD